MRELRKDIKDSFGEGFEELGIATQITIIIMAVMAIPIGAVYGYYLNRKNLRKIKRVVKSARDRMNRINVSQESSNRIADEFEVQMDKYMQKIKVRHIKDKHLADIDKIVNDIINKEVYM